MSGGPFKLRHKSSVTCVGRKNSCRREGSMRLRLRLALVLVTCHGQGHGHCQYQQGLSVICMVSLVFWLELELGCVWGQYFQCIGKASVVN